MTSADWNTLVEIAMSLLSTIVVPWAILAYQKRTGVQITDQQRAAVQASLTTAAGIIETRIDQGQLSVAALDPDHRLVTQEAMAALRRVPDAAAAEGMTTQAAASIIVGRVDTAPRPRVVAFAPTVIGVPAPAIPRA